MGGEEKKRRPEGSRAVSQERGTITFPQTTPAAEHVQRLEEERTEFSPSCPEERTAGERTPPRPLQLDISNFSGERYFSEYPPPFDWLLKGSLRAQALGAMIGAPGSGKSTAAAQLVVAVAAGLPWLGAWEPATPGRAMYLTAEDDDAVLHRRIHHALKTLPEAFQEQAARNVYAVPVSGTVALCRGVGGDVVKTAALADLRGHLEKLRPALLVLDTFSRFIAVQENDNPTMTAACGILEELCRDFGCSIILLHHTAKTTGALAADDMTLKSALEQTASRGASALAGCVRWQLNLAPLTAKYAVKIIGDDARGRPDGAFLALRVSKKNAGVPEPKYFLERCEHGLLRRVEPEAQEREAQSVEADAEALAAEVRRRAEEGRMPLAASKGYVAFDKWGAERYARAKFHAVDAGTIQEVKKTGGKGFILMPRSRAGESSKSSGESSGVGNIESSRQPELWSFSM